MKSNKDENGLTVQCVSRVEMTQPLYCLSTSNYLLSSFLRPNTQNIYKKHTLKNILLNKKFETSTNNSVVSFLYSGHTLDSKTVLIISLLFYNYF